MEQLLCLKCRKSENLARTLTGGTCRYCGGSLTKITVALPYKVPDWEVGTQCAICGIRDVCDRRAKCYGLTPAEFSKRFHAGAPPVLEPTGPEYGSD